MNIFPDLLCGLPKVVLDAPLGRQVVVVARVLRDLDLPLPGGHGVPPAGPSAGAELEGELVAALGGLHIHWRRVNATKKIQMVTLGFSSLCCPELTPQMLGGEGPVGLPTLNSSIRHWPALDRRTAPPFCWTKTNGKNIQ